jgi:hypothetical protein
MPHTLSSPGQLVDLGGNRMHIHCVGQGSPTVVLDAGLGGFHSIGTSSNRTWLPQLASAPTTVPATAGATRVLNLGHRGRLPRNCTLCCLRWRQRPYVPVGHSAAGKHVRLYADLYPQEVAATYVHVASWRSTRLQTCADRREPT